MIEQLQLNNVLCLFSSVVFVFDNFVCFVLFCICVVFCCVALDLLIECRDVLCCVVLYCVVLSSVVLFCSFLRSI